MSFDELSGNDDAYFIAHHTDYLFLAGEDGFEPSYLPPKGSVLPLDDSPPSVCLGK